MSDPVSPIPSRSTLDTIYLTIVRTLSLIVLAMVLAMLIGLFDPNVDNKVLVPILGNGFTTILGAFVGIIGGLAMGATLSK